MCAYLLFFNSEVPREFYIVWISLHLPVQDVFHERVKVYQNWQHAQLMLNKKREQKAKLELSGKPDRGNSAGVEVVEVFVVSWTFSHKLISEILFWSVWYWNCFQWQAKVERGQEEFDAISQMIKKEMERFEINRVKDFKQTIINYLENLMLHQQQVIHFFFMLIFISLTCVSFWHFLKIS